VGIGITGDWGTVIPDHNTIQNNIVHMTWGEGINVGNTATNSIIQDNISYDNNSVDIYITNAQTVLCQRNLVYNTGAMDAWDTYGDLIGILIGDEEVTSKNTYITVINNLVYGTRGNLFVGWMDNVIIANNTLVNSAIIANVTIQNYAQINSFFENNVVRQDDALAVISANDASGVTYNYNCWSKTAPVHARGANDVTANPLLAETDTYANPLWYKLQNGSPARGVGLALAEVINDYWETPRSDPPDMGAHEYT
jgi:hypothetical protein